MRFRIVLLLFTFIQFHQGFAQFANSWIKTGQSYYKISIAEEGVYKLTYSDLVNAGVPIATVDPRLIQLFHRGKEQAILVQGQSDASFDAIDYLEFYGQANDGTRDKLLYKPESAQPHNYYNLYSDTTAYFLTWNLAPVPGKRIAVFDEANVTNIPKEVAHSANRLLINKSEYAGGYTEGDVLQFTHFDVGEGWTGKALQQTQTIDYTLDLISNTAPVAGNPSVEILLVGRDNISHAAEIFVGPTVSSMRSIGTHTFNGFETLLINTSINWSDVGTDGKFIVRLMAGAATTNRFQFSTSYIKVKFPQTFESAALVEKVFTLNQNPTGKSFVEFTNAPSNLRVWDVTDPAQVTAIGTRTAPGSLTSVIGSTNTIRKLFTFTTTRTAIIKKAGFRFIDPQQPDYIIITHAALTKPALTYSNPVKAYAGYRASDVGGSYDTLVVHIDQLYNQFNYGETSPVAIYEFMKYLVEQGRPSYLFLIGKGRDVSAGFYRINNPGVGILKDFVPTAGMPGSDLNFTVGLNGTSFEPAVPTGRLSVTTSLEVAHYLNKIKEVESANTSKQWQKEGLHLSGGIQDVELGIFRAYLEGFKTTAEDAYWGGHISTIAKREAQPVELINISDEINEGVNLVTFFGHSSPSTIDIDIGFATNPILGYDNPGKYPVFLINGCNAGAFFSNGVIFGEDWITAPNKGARNFIAHSSFGFSSTLRTYSEYFYRVGFADSVYISKGIGDVQKEAARQYMLTAPPIMAHITQVQQMVLLGDPAVKLFQNSNPDYEINTASLSITSFDQKSITALSDSFNIRVIVKNKGLVKDKKVKVSVTRTLSSGVSIHYDSLVGPFFNQDTVYIMIRRDVESGAGNNSFRVEIDPDNKITESDEGNNEATLNVFIPSSATLNLLPANFGIVTENKARLIWQSSDILSAKRDYFIEIDTTISFSSPAKISKTVNAKVLGFTVVDLLPQDSIVYYWRTRYAQPLPGESLDWTTSSFSFMANGSEGWAQLTKDQAKENFFNAISNNGNGKPFRFDESKTSVEIKTFGSNNPLPSTDVSVRINQAEYNLATQGQPCRNNTINLIAFDKNTAVPYAGLPFNFQDPRTCGREPQLINSFTATEIQAGDLQAFVDAVDVSDSVVIFSIGNADYPNWSVAAKTKLNELGISTPEINMWQAGEPIIIFGKKGTLAGSAMVLKSPLFPANEQLIIHSKSITGRKSSGTMKSSVIGPAKQWSSFVFNEPQVEVSEQFHFTVYGIDAEGKDSLLIDNIISQRDLSAISATQFPYLRVEYNTIDEIDLTPVNWKNWIVHYEPVAEGVILYKGVQPTVVVQEGESWNAQFAFANISTKNYDTALPVEIDLVTKQTQSRSAITFNIEQPAAGDTTFFNVILPTVGKSGMNDLHISVNNRVVPELSYENNTATLSDYLNVMADRIAPVLEVTFDGRLLSNGDYVSTTPKIVLSLRDENSFLLKTDTAGVSLLLAYPCATGTCDFTRISFSSNEVKWFPATATSNFRVEFSPLDLPDGEYILSAQATDASGNLSAADPYQVNFQVKAETTLSFKGVHPNPSSTGFRFSFLATGNTLPENFLLEIFSPTGQLITTFDSADVQNFYIGNNQIFWNGADASGQLLTNGVYYYRIFIKAGSTETLNTGKLIWIR